MNPSSSGIIQEQRVRSWLHQHSVPFCFTYLNRLPQSLEEAASWRILMMHVWYPSHDPNPGHVESHECQCQCRCHGIVVLWYIVSNDSNIMATRIFQQNTEGAFAPISATQVRQRPTFGEIPICAMATTSDRPNMDVVVKLFSHCALPWNLSPVARPSRPLEPTSIPCSHLLESSNGTHHIRLRTIVEVRLKAGYVIVEGDVGSARKLRDDCISPRNQRPPTTFVRSSRVEYCGKPPGVGCVLYFHRAGAGAGDATFGVDEGIRAADGDVHREAT